MKRFLTIVLALCLCMSMAIFAVSCDKTGETEETAATTDAATTEAPTTEETSEEATTEEVTTEEVTQADTGYKVKVVDADGNAIAGVWIMVCKGDMCSMPVETGADGYAKFPTITDEGRQAKIAYPVDGYVVDTEAYIDFEAGSFEMTIVLEKAA